MLHATRRAFHVHPGRRAYGRRHKSTNVTTAAYPPTGANRCVERIAAVRPRKTLHRTTRTAPMIPGTEGCRQASRPSDTPKFSTSVAVTA